MKILVTGGAGFIASHISDAYLAAGHEVVIVDDLSSGKRANLPAAAKFYHADIRSPEAREIIRNERPRCSRTMRRRWTSAAPSPTRRSTPR